MIGKLSYDGMEEVLRNNLTGRLGCTDGKRPYIVPVNYVYDGKCIIAHSLEGMKIELMRKNPQVCFEVEEMKSFTKWKTVICWGEYQELTDERDRYYAMKMFVEKMLHLKVSESAKPPELAHQRIHPTTGNVRPIIYRIVILEKTGRFEEE